MMDAFTMTGSRHRAANVENQDAFFHASNLFGMVGTLADGVSSCAHAGDGARQSAAALGFLLSRHGEHLSDMPREDAALCAVTHMRYDLDRLARQSDIPVEEYSSAVAGVFWPLDGGELLTVNLGDCLILGVDDTPCCKVLSIPADSRNGCPATTTPGAEHMMQIRLHRAEKLRRVMICSDGAWDLMFSREGRLAPDVSRWLCSGDLQSLKEYIANRAPVDDASFVMLQRPGVKAGSKEVFSDGKEPPGQKSADQIVPDSRG